MRRLPPGASERGAGPKPGPPRPRPRRSRSAARCTRRGAGPDGSPARASRREARRHQGGAHPAQRAARGGAPRPNRATAPRRRPAKAAAPKQKPAAAPKPEHAHAAHWSYEGEGGPASWGAMKPEFAKCASGTRQSPIDIRGASGPARPGALRLQTERLPRHRQRPHRAGQRRAGQQHRGDGAALRTRAVPLPPPLGRAHRRPPVRHGRAPRAQGSGRPPRRGGGAARARQRQPVVQKIWNNLPLEKGEEVPARDTLDLGRCCRPSAATSPTWAR